MDIPSHLIKRLDFICNNNWNWNNPSAKHEISQIKANQIVDLINELIQLIPSSSHQPIIRKEIIKGLIDSIEEV